MIIQQFIILQREPEPLCKYCERKVFLYFDDPTWGFTKDWRGEVDTFHHTECLQLTENPPELREDNDDV